MQKRIAIIGGGWYGCHIALALKKRHPLYEVAIFEKNSELLNEISGNFGIRLHAGPHYPRSPATRHDCHKGFLEFRANYEELVNDHKYSIYGLGNLDCNCEPSKVNAQTFACVCKEFGNSFEIDPIDYDYKNLEYAANIDEPSIVVGPRLRKFFADRLTEFGVQLFSSTNVTGVERKDNGIFIKTANVSMFQYDEVVNASGFKSLLPTSCGESLPVGMEVVYQICSAFIYKRSSQFNISLDGRDERPFSFIVMDGWFPCVMPYDDRVDKDIPVSKYMVTHGKWTILGSYRTHEAAQEALSRINHDAIENTIRKICEKDLRNFFPFFLNEFEYDKLIMTILPKIKTDREFRSAVTFQDTRDGLIHIIPGKINNIFDAEREVFALMGLDIWKRSDLFINEDHWRFVKEGTLYDATTEINDKLITARNTCTLQAYNEILNLVEN